MATGRWEEVAEVYNRIFRKDSYYWEVLDIVVGEAVAGEGKVVLDIGCGTGNIIALLRKRYPGTKICGVDPADNMVRLVRDRFRDDAQVEIMRGEGTKIPYLSEHFDYVVSNLALHHVLPELRPLCASEIARVLKPGGRLVYSDLFWDVPGERDDPARCKDIIDKIVAYALYNLDLGALEMTLFLCEQLPLHLEEKDEYVTVVEDWLEILDEAGLTEVEATIPHHPEFGFKLIHANKPGL
jgi:ubiquinone/menaquinone biosynthesis C-methylase UbiE